MGSGDKFSRPDSERVKSLGLRFETIRKMMSDFRILTNKAYLNKLLGELDEIRRELIQINCATQIDDGSLIIKTEMLVPFLNPLNSGKIVFSNRPLDLTDPAVIRRVALECSMNQWMFLAKRLPSDEARKQFILLCISEIQKSNPTSDPT